MAGFGKKGAGQTAPSGNTHLSSQAQAFIASERARAQQEQARPAPAERANLSRTDYSADYAPDWSTVRQNSGLAARPSTGTKSMVLAYVFWWFCAPLGAHRFYLGAYQSGIAMIGLFFGGVVLGVATGSGWPALLIFIWFAWIVVDLFLIPGLTRRANNPPVAHAFG